MSDFGVMPSIVNLGIANIVKSTISRSTPNARQPMVFSDGGSATVINGDVFGGNSGPLLGHPRGVAGAADASVFYSDDTTLQANQTDRAATPAQRFRLLDGVSQPVAALRDIPPTVRLRMLSKEDPWFLQASQVRQNPRKAPASPAVH